MCRVWDFGALHPPWDVLIKLLPSRLIDIYGKGSRSIVRGRGEGWLQGNSVIQTQQDWYMYELTSILKIHTGHVQVQTRQNPSIENCKWKLISTPNKEGFLQLITVGKGKISPFQRSVTGDINHTLGQGPCQRTVGQYKVDSIAFVLFHYFLSLCFSFYIQRTWSWGDEGEEDLGGAGRWKEYVQNTLYVKLNENKENLLIKFYLSGPCKLYLTCHLSDY